MVISFKKLFLLLLLAAALPGSVFMMQGGDDDRREQEHRLQQEAAELKRKNDEFRKLPAEEQAALHAQAEKKHAEKLAQRKALMAQRRQEEAAQRDREDEQIKRQRLANAGEGASGIAAEPVGDAAMAGDAVQQQVDPAEEKLICYCQNEEVRSPLVALPCHKDHIFHESCLAEWVGGNPSCPMCRAVISPTFLHEHNLLVNVPAWLARTRQDAILGTESFFNNCEDILTTVISYCTSDNSAVRDQAVDLAMLIVTGTFIQENVQGDSALLQRDPYWAKLTNTHFHDLSRIILSMFSCRDTGRPLIGMALVMLLNLASQPDKLPALDGSLNEIFCLDDAGGSPDIVRCIEISAFVPALIDAYVEAESMKARLMQQVVEPARACVARWLDQVRGRLERCEVSLAELIEHERAALEVCLAVEGSDQAVFAQEIIDGAWRSGEVPVDPSLLLSLVRRFVKGTPTATGRWVRGLLKDTLCGEDCIKFENDQMRRAWGEQIWGVYRRFCTGAVEVETDDEKYEMIFAVLQFMYPAALAVLCRASEGASFIEVHDTEAMLRCVRTRELLSKLYSISKKQVNAVVSSLLGEARDDLEVFCANQARVQGLLYMAAFAYELQPADRRLLTKLIELIGKTGCLNRFIPLIAELMANDSVLPPVLFDYIDCEQLLECAGALPYFQLRAGEEVAPVPENIAFLLYELPINHWPQAGKSAYAQLLRVLQRQNIVSPLCKSVYLYWLHCMPSEEEKAEFADIAAENRNLSIGYLRGLRGGRELLASSFIQSLERYCAGVADEEIRLNFLWEDGKFVMASSDQEGKPLQQALIRALVAARDCLLRTDHGVEMLKFVLYDMTTEQRLTCLEAVNAINQPCCSADTFAFNCASCGTNLLADRSLRIRFLRAAARHFPCLQPNTVFSLLCETISLTEEDFAELPLEELGVPLLGVLLERFNYSAGPDVGQFRLGYEILERAARHEQCVVRSVLGPILTDLACNFRLRFSAANWSVAARERGECEILLIEFLANHLTAFDQFTQEEADAIKILEDEAIPHMSEYGQAGLAAALREHLPVIKSNGRMPRPVVKSRRCGEGCSIQ